MCLALKTAQIKFGVLPTSFYGSKTKLLFPFFYGSLINAVREQLSSENEVR